MLLISVVRSPSYFHINVIISLLYISMTLGTQFANSFSSFLWKGMRSQANGNRESMRQVLLLIEIRTFLKLNLGDQIRSEIYTNVLLY